VIWIYNNWALPLHQLQHFYHYQAFGVFNLKFGLETVGLILMYRHGRFNRDGSVAEGKRKARRILKEREESNSVGRVELNILESLKSHMVFEF
jgi:hypothetical protein